MCRHFVVSLCAAVVICACLALPVRAAHITDGIFSPGEWNGSTVSVSPFPLVGNSGGAALYVDQATPGVALQTILKPPSPTTLFLGYDVYANPAGSTAPTASSFFDVFFQVASEGNDYVVHIGTNSLQLYEKPTGSPGGVLPNGQGFDLSQAPWQLLSNTDADFLKANPIGAIGFGPTPNNATPHDFVEFQLNINNTAPGRSPDPNSPNGGDGESNLG